MAKEPKDKASASSAKSDSKRAKGASAAKKSAASSKTPAKPKKAPKKAKTNGASKVAAVPAAKVEKAKKSVPDVSIVIPVYNEEGILSASIADLTEKLAVSDKLRDLDFEIILAENGSVDRTIEVAHKLIGRHPNLRMIHSDKPDYGRALKLGIQAARGTLVICDEIDLCDVDFYERALYRLREEGYDLVVGSKCLERSFDKRPPFRRAATQVINGLLRAFVGFRGTDTHGLKAFKRERVLPVVERCVVEKDMFASELVIRVERDDSLRSTEIPVEVIEKRAPSVQLTRRVPAVLKNIATLTWEIRLRNR